MGMAASQARLLTLTARLSDVEFQAQSIQHAKIQLATQSDQVYQEYLAALDETTLAINCINPNTAQTANIAATFNNLCSRNRVQSANGTQYALRNSSGLLIVEDDIYEAYNKDFSNAYEFAMFMMLGEGDENVFNDGSGDIDGIFRDKVEDAELAIAESKRNENSKLDQVYGKLLEMLENALIDLGLTDLLDSENDPPTIYDIPTLCSPIPEGYEETLAQYREILYSNYSTDIYEKLCEEELPGYTPTNNNDSKEQFKEEINYYISIYNQIQFCGGCISIEDYNGPSGDASNDSEWLTNMIKSGLITIEEIDIDKLTGDTVLKQASAASGTCISYIEKSAIDNRALAKAEAKYEHDLKQINAKDKKFDMDLAKLETERNALTTQIKGVEKVIEDNIKQSFKIFS